MFLQSVIENFKNQSKPCIWCMGITRHNVSIFMHKNNIWRQKDMCYDDIGLSML